jgi:hypothetical protein
MAGLETGRSSPDGPDLLDYGVCHGPHVGADLPDLVLYRMLYHLGPLVREVAEPA